MAVHRGFWRLFIHLVVCAVLSSSSAHPLIASSPHLSFTMNNQQFEVDPRIRAPNGTRQVAPKHPSRGGNPYSDDMRRQVLEMHLNGFDLDTPELNALREEYKFPCLDTCRNWIDIFYETGDILPKRAMGNNHVPNVRYRVRFLSNLHSTVVSIQRQHLPNAVHISTTLIQQ